MSTSTLADGRNHNGQLEITDYPLVQGHVVVHHPQSGINTVNLEDLMGYGSYGTVWTWLQKLRRCTINNEREKLSGWAEGDKFFLCGQSSGKRGRGSENKTIVAVADERWNIKKRMRRIRLQVELDFTGYTLETFIYNSIEQGAMIATDSWYSDTMVDEELFGNEKTNQHNGRMKK